MLVVALRGPPLEGDGIRYYWDEWWRLDCGVFVQQKIVCRVVKPVDPGEKLTRRSSLLSKA